VPRDDGMRRTVLVVEDEDELRAMVRNVLSWSGYRVLEAPSGEAALAVFESEQPDLMLLDIRLPGIDGWEVLVQLHGLGRLKSLPVVVFSAYDAAPVAARAAGFGCRAFVQKPFSIRELLATLERVLAEQGGAASGFGDAVGREGNRLP
jgi:two-component system cell cycle response regulator DivK